MEKVEYITKDFVNSNSTIESVRVYSITNVHSGKTEVVIDRTISERFPVEQLNETIQMAEICQMGGGRRIVSVQDLIDIYKGIKEIK